MQESAYHLKLVLILTFGFASAGLLGYLSQCLKLSPVLGYLIAGYFIGPHSPGFVADSQFAEQLAEVGIILMMFGVGLHFKWQDLLKVKNVAIPGAVGQVLLTACLGCLVMQKLGWSFETSLIISLAISIASTVVMVRMLEDYHLLNSLRGHTAVGWLIVEDILTIAFLILMPVLADFASGIEISLSRLSYDLSWALVKFLLLITLMLTLGKNLVAFIMKKVARTRSHELFTLIVLALTFVIATLSALVFDMSIALGAFIAGVVIGQSEVRDQASADALPLKDAFVVIFFLSIGMLFNPEAVAKNRSLFVIVLSMILVAKPLIAFGLTFFLQHSIKSALTLAVALAQIGEFSFILIQEAMKAKLVPQDSYDIIIACALITIGVNPILFKIIDWASAYFGNIIYSHSGKASYLKKHNKQAKDVIIVGFGPLGQNIALFFSKKGFLPTIIEHNIDTVTALRSQGLNAIFGDASSLNILELTPIKEAQFLIITVPNANVSFHIIEAARQLNPGIQIIVRARYLVDQPSLERLGAKTICCEHESMKAFNKVMTASMGF